MGTSSSGETESVLPDDTEVKKKCTWSRCRWLTFAAITVCGILALVGITIFVEYYRRKFSLRVDCHPEKPLNYNRCMDRGCWWLESNIEAAPPCFFPNGYGYRLSGEPRATKNGYIVSLNRSPKKTIFGNEVDTVSLEVFQETDTRLRIKITDPTSYRYEVPLPLPSPPDQQPPNLQYNISFVDDPQFGIQVRRNSNGKLIFNTNIPGMVFSDQFLQVTTELVSSNVYGLGEHRTERFKHSTDWKHWSFFASDAGPMDDLNLYGVHPFYMNVDGDGLTHGVFFMNSNAMDFVLQPYPALTFRTTGGILDFYIFLGPTPENVVQQYLQVVGLPMMPPYWSLGFQISRWGYKNLDEVKKVVDDLRKANIPQDVQYFDIDYMDEKKDFTYDKKNFAQLPQFAEELHKKNMKLIVILDPAIPSNSSLRQTYPPLDKGLEMDVFIKQNGIDFEGEVWPGQTFYPDFSHDRAEEYWHQLCKDLHNNISYDGLWIDMNEPSNFVSNCTNNKWNNPPYAAGVRGSFEKNHAIYTKTVCMDAQQKIGSHYDVHNLYGHLEAKVTFDVLQRIFPGKRPMIVSRSTFAGSGRYTSHWLGDNRSWWSQLRDSIPGMLEFNLFGFPMVGADICGFFENTTEELCLRWHQLGAFYPFSRNHNGMGFKNQIPTALGKMVEDATRLALNTRYSLLPYLYTCFHLAHTQGTTVARPMVHEFPTDSTAWDISFQFLWGGGLLISPIVWEGEKSVDAYIPDGSWYDFYTGALLKAGAGTVIRLPDEGRVNLHVRGGWIIPLQKPLLTTADSRKQPMELLVAPDEKGQATGMLFWDDGESYETFETGNFLLLNFIMEKVDSSQTLTVTVSHHNYPDAAQLYFDTVTLTGQPELAAVTVDGTQLSKQSWTYDKTNKVVKISSLKLNIIEGHVLLLTPK